MGGGPSAVEVLEQKVKAIEGLVLRKEAQRARLRDTIAMRTEDLRACTDIESAQETAATIASHEVSCGAYSAQIAQLYSFRRTLERQIQAVQYVDMAREVTETLRDSAPPDAEALALEYAKAADEVIGLYNTIAGTINAPEQEQLADRTQKILERYNMLQIETIPLPPGASDPETVDLLERIRAAKS